VPRQTGGVHRSRDRSIRRRTAWAESANRAAPQNKISSIIRKAREEAGVPRDVESGQRLHDALGANPAAKL